MILKVKKWCPEIYDNCHICEDVKGEEIRIDLMISGDVDIEPEELVGKIAEVNCSHCNLLLAHDVKLFEKVEK